MSEKKENAAAAVVCNTTTASLGVTPTNRSISDDEATPPTRSHIYDMYSMYLCQEEVFTLRKYTE